ncbi:MAG: c-type cytochrome [Deltaproteobacteria bacterium]|nr:c-type cytochrome [Deltaproteobacteria bacterium]
MASKNGHSNNHTKAYVGVFIALLVLTFVTVEVSYHDFGAFNMLVAMLVACLKAALVCLIFMHLRYDNKMNQTIFAFSIIFLVIFIGLTASDLLVRPTIVEAKVQAVQGPSGVNSAKMNELRVSTPALLAKGKELYAQNCTSCHGASGQGDGPAAGALNPKPRNFTQDAGWKNGRSPAQIFKTLTKGLEGTSMASFSTLSTEDRWALVHFVESLGPQPVPQDSDQALADIGIQKDGEAKAAQESVELPISFAIDRLVQEAAKKN